jgi:hypothetical protein
MKKRSESISTRSAIGTLVLSGLSYSPLTLSKPQTEKKPNDHGSPVGMNSVLRIEADTDWKPELIKLGYSEKNVIPMSVTSPIHKYSGSYLSLRRAVGWIGILLPLILILGNALVFNGEPFLHSISRYYHGGMRDVFVGGLCAMALFLFFYSGFDRWENWAGTVAGIFAVGVAVFPVANVGAESGPICVCHYICAFGLFLTLALYSMFLFSRERWCTGGKTHRTAVFHKLCGLIIIGCMLAVIVHSVVSDCDKSQCVFVLVAETVALVAFGLSWLIENRVLKTKVEEDNKWVA